MRPRTALPLVLLFASGCVQVPSEGDAVLAERQPAARVVSAPIPAPLAVTPDASPDASAPASVPAPKLQAAAELATPTPVAAVEPLKSLWPRITGGFGMAPMDNEAVREWENWYSSRP